LSRLRRHSKPLIVLAALFVAALVFSACAFIKPGSLSLSQPGGIGSAQVHFVLCTEPEESGCTPTEDTEEVQYLLGIAVPPGSTPPATVTATPIGAGSPLVFTRNDEVATEIAAASSNLQKLAEKEGEGGKPGTQAWPPAGLQGVGYLSSPLLEQEGVLREWNFDADFGLPVAADGSPFSGPFATALAYGSREITPTQSSSRPVHCWRFEGSPEESDSFCVGIVEQGQVGTSDLRIAAPAKATQVFVGGTVPVKFEPKFASSATTPPGIGYTATSTLKGAKAVVGKNGTVNVTVPKNAKPGTYEVTLTGTAQVANGASSSGAAKIKVTKPSLKLGGVKYNKARGTALVSVKVPGAGTLTASGNGIVNAKKKAKKAKTLKIAVKAKGKTKGQLEEAGKAKVKAKFIFKPSSGISVTKKKSLTLKES
jgi:hypothetical protein